MAVLWFGLTFGCIGSSAFAELLPVSPLPPEGSFWTNFEILPAGESQGLPQGLRDIESGRLQAEQAVVNGKAYRKTSMILPLANGDRRETILLLAEEEGRMRMLGFHRVHRHQANAQGKTIVFQSGAANPLSGEPSQVPPDTYTHLALCTALSGFGGERPPLSAHLWTGNSVTPVEIGFDGRETLEALGTRVPTVRVRVRAKNRGDEAIYWLAEAEPHTLLQYRGPGDFLAEDAGGTRVVLRATASSEQVRKIFQR